MSINELFTNESTATNSSARMLSGTAELTRISSGIAISIIRSMEEQIDDYKERIAKSAVDAKEMDELINEFKPWPEIDENSVLYSLSEETVDGMLKSQQSKRSRTKGKAMTLDNYTQLMTASIAESILREIYNRPKSAAFGNRRSHSLEYTEEELAELEADQEALRKEIRNIQSKKSIMKSKAEFDESSEQWQALLIAEQTLKNLRVGGVSSRVIEVDYTKDRLTEMLAEVDPDNLKAADSKELLTAIKSMLL